MARQNHTGNARSGAIESYVDMWGDTIITNTETGEVKRAHTDLLGKTTITVEKPATSATSSAASSNPLVQKINAMRTLGTPVTAESVLKAAGVASPTPQQIAKFGELYKASPTKLTEDLANIAMQVAAMPASTVVTTTQTQYGPPSAPPPSSYGGGGGSGIPYNAQVAEAQQLLTAQGFNPGGVDGKLGNNTRAAITKFQAANGLPATGNLDAATLAKLRGGKSATPGAGASAKGMSTGMKVGLALAGAAVIGGGLWFVLKDDEPGA